ncbi:MAG TPA: low molecular weight protein arginine phosphatase [Acetivibrio sp.]|jgi:protein-tyrosine-phosphatase|nr:low molecular weight protein arginine phosphatase [Acetivibrio sp.]
MRKILFVCTGNTCRSSMAEGLFNHIAKNGVDGMEDYTALSAGIFAFEGDGANPKAIKVLKEGYGIDISSHRARRIKKSDVEDAHIILTMTKDHKNTLVGIFPEAKDKTWTLKEYASGKKSGENTQDSFEWDIPDPYGMPEEVYERCALTLKEAIDRLILRLKEEKSL